MPLVEKRIINEDGKLGLWRITETEEFFRQKLILSHKEYQYLEKAHLKRRLEWLASRWLIKLVAGQQAICLKDRLGKPYLKNSTQHLSISHSKDLAVVSIGKQALGIDIQAITPKIKRVAHKFMRHEEAQSLLESTYLEHLTVYWSAKEALFKAYGKKELDFRRHILVSPFDYEQKGTFKGVVTKGDFYATYDLMYEKMGDYMFVHAVEVAPVSFSRATVM